MISFSARHFGAVSKCKLRCGMTLCNFSRCQTGSIHLKYLHRAANQFTANHRYFFTWLSKYGTKQGHFKKDGIEKRTHDLVYFSPHVNYAVLTQAICSMTAVAIAAMVSINAFMDQDGDLDHYASADHNIVFDHWTEAVFMLVAFGVIAMAATYVCRHMVLRLYYNGSKNSFVAVVPHWVPFKVSKMEFAGGQMKLVQAATAIQHFRGEYLLRNERYIISKYYFRSPYHYNVMMGYEKPNHAESDQSNID